MKSTYQSHGRCVYKLSYHTVFAVKDMRPVITNEIGVFLTSRCADLIEGWGGHFIQGSYSPASLHLVFDMDPQHELAKYMAAMKQRISREVRHMYPERVSAYFPSGGFWAQSYFLASFGSVTDEDIKDYLSSLRK